MTGTMAATAADTVFAGPMPAVYDRYLGPLIFMPYATDLAARLVDLRPLHVLETAAGTGVVTRTLKEALPDETTIDATDLNEAMLAYATQQFSSPRVNWRQADALALPFADGTFDAVVCQFGVMFYPDKVRAFKEALRVLRPGGCFLFNVWDRIEENEFSDTVTRALATVFPDDPPTFMARTPHGYHDTAEIRKQLEGAGFTNIRVDTVSKEGRAPSSREPAIGFCQGLPLRHEIEARDPTRLQEATDVADAALVSHFGAGAVTGRIKAHVISARY